MEDETPQLIPRKVFYKNVHALTGMLLTPPIDQNPRVFHNLSLIAKKIGEPKLAELLKKAEKDFARLLKTMRELNRQTAQSAEPSYAI